MNQVYSEYLHECKWIISEEIYSYDNFSKRKNISKINNNNQHETNRQFFQINLLKGNWFNHF